MIQTGSEIVPGTGNWYREQNKLRAKRFREKLEARGMRQTSIYIKKDFLDQIKGSRHEFFDSLLKEYFDREDKNELVKKSRD